MEIGLNAKVLCTDGDAGNISRLIVNPLVPSVTHLVVEQAVVVTGLQFVVPIELIIVSTFEMVHLNCSRDKLIAMHPFLMYEYLGGRIPYYTYARDEHMMESYALPETGEIPIEHEGIPAGSVALRRGAHVEATDGRVGQVSTLLVMPETHLITHVSARAGHFWSQIEIMIPLSQILRIEEDAIYLEGDKQSLEGLPTKGVGHKWF